MDDIGWLVKLSYITYTYGQIFNIISADGCIEVRNNESDYTYA